MIDWAEIEGIEKAARWAMAAAEKAENDMTEKSAVHAADAEWHFRQKIVVTPSVIIALIEENRHLRTAVEIAHRYVKSQNNADHMMDGFGPRSTQPSDMDLEIISSVLGRISK